MKNLKVILRQNLDNLGSTGDLVTVKPGYARNYLFPRGLAFEATAANIRQLDEDRRRGEQKTKRDFLEARRRATQLEGVSLTFNANAGEEGKLFGAITSADITDRLNEQGLDYQIDRRWIDQDPIKSLGVYAVAIRLHTDVRPEIKVWVIKAD